MGFHVFPMGLIRMQKDYNGKTRDQTYPLESSIALDNGSFAQSNYVSLPGGELWKIHERTVT